jgi:hypothetical protein
LKLKIEKQRKNTEGEVFRVVIPCSVVVGYQRFRGPCCLHLQGEQGRRFLPEQVMEAAIAKPERMKESLPL